MKAQDRPLEGVFRDSADRDVHVAAGHKIEGAIIYEFGAAFQVCSCGTKIHVPYGQAFGDGKP